MTTPTPEQLKQWREEFERPTHNATPMLAILLYARETDCEYANNYVESEWQGFLRAKTDMLDMMKLARFGARVLANTQFTYAEVRDLAIECGVAQMSGENWITIEQLLKE